jgi:hypothetical protein
MQMEPVYRSLDATVPYPHYPTLAAPVSPTLWIAVTILASAAFCEIPLKALDKHDPWWLMPLLVGTIVLQCAAVCYWLVGRFKARRNQFAEFAQFHKPRWCSVSNVRIQSTTFNHVGEIARLRATIDDNIVVEFSVEGLQKPRLIELGFLAVRASTWSYIVDGALDRQQHPIAIVPDARLSYVVKDQSA